MGRSSEIRLLALLMAAGFAATAAQARGFAPFAPHPMVLRPAFPARAATVRYPVRQPRPLDPRNPGLTIGQTLVAQGRHPRRRFFGGGLGYDGYDGYDAGDLGYGAVPQPAAAEADLPPPPYAIPAPAGPCLPPQIIAINGGLAHPPKTRVVYGTPACGGY